MKQIVYIALQGMVAASLAYPTSSLQAETYGFRHTQFFSDPDGIITNTQVWDITARGENSNEIYFATNDGLFVFNGISMECLKNECNTILRAARYDEHSGRLYTAGVNEFGWWEKDCFGNMRYHNIFHNPDFRSSSYDFWRIALHCGQRDTVVLFQCKEMICEFSPSAGTISSITPENSFRYMYDCGENVYYQDGTEIRSYAGNRLNPGQSISGRVVNIIPSRRGLIVAVENKGLMIIEPDGKVTELDRESNKILGKAKITDCRRYDENRLMIGTTVQGIFITDENGKIDHSIKIDSELDNSTVLCTARDKSGNIWLGMDSGVAMIDNSSSDYYLTDNRFGQIHDIVRINDNELLIGSNKGLFLIGQDRQTSLIDGRAGSVWEINLYNGQIFISHDKGLFLLTENLQMKPLYTDTGVFCIRQLHSDRKSFVLGTYSGLALMKLESGSDTPSFTGRIKNYKGFTRNIDVDAMDRVWVTVARTGFVRLSMDREKLIVSEEKAFDLAAGNGKEVFSTIIDGKLFICNSDKAFEVDNPDGEPFESRGAEEILREAGHSTIDIIQDGNRFWYHGADGFGYIERFGAELKRHHGVLRYAQRERVTHLSPIGEGCAIGYKNGIGFCYGSSSSDNSISISKVLARGSRKDIYYDFRKSGFTVPSSNNTICIYVSCSMPGSNDVQYRISGKDESWHNVLLGDCIQIPSLSFGKHSIEIRSASNHNAACSLPVKIQVPWYISWEMILVYGILIILMISGTRVYYKEKNRRIQEEEIKRLEYQNLLKEKKISEIEKEKLRNELKYKGKELANMALNNSRRKGMISGLIAKLEKISTYDDSDEIKQNASALIKQLDSQLKDESEWQKSEDYFNTIYDGLLDRLKASYPSLSKTDLKLCVYIKLNMSTKEIADLMNISPRSVEMGRYRLRKKLGLRPEDEISSILK
ncbi:MAG: hypothetical protein PUA96_07315 [Bacteroidales bacterium]|nr:hypothetical protein [Bacteroidales bacterium]